MKAVYPGLLSVLFLSSCFLFKPHIESLNGVVASVGDRVEINGRFFGRRRAGSRVFFDSIPVTSASIVEWDSRRIVFQAPRARNVVLIQVKTIAGTSKGVVLGDSRRFPKVHDGSWLPDAPFVEHYEPVSGGPGTLVSLRGKDFGDRIGSSRIWVNRSDFSLGLSIAASDLDKYMQVEPEEIKTWTDNLVSFWIPGGFSSGYLLVQMGSALSNPVFFDRVAAPGMIVEEDEREWKLLQRVQIRRVGAFAGNELYVHMPLPLPGTGQGGAELRYYDPLPLRRGDSLTIFELKELQTGGKRRITQEVAVKTYSVRTRVRAAALGTPDVSRPELRRALVEDEWIKPAEFTALARRVSARAGDDWSRAALLYDYVLEQLTWDEAAPKRALADYLEGAGADSRGYSFLLCSLVRAVGIPARPIGGIIIDADNESRPWWWVEMWVEGLGWVPLDPALGSGAVVIADLPAASGTAADYYRGNLEGRHVAFSRGILESDSVRAFSRSRSPSHGQYSLQSVWEETVGNIESYKSFWEVPEYVEESLVENEEEKTGR